MIILLDNLHLHKNVLRIVNLMIKHMFGIIQIHYKIMYAQINNNVVKQILMDLRK